MSKNKKPPSPDDSENDLVKQITDELLPGPVLSPNDPAAALAAIEDWQEEWLAMVEVQKPKAFALSKDLEGFIERTNYLAWWCESLGLDSTPLVQFSHDARETYFTLRPTLPAVPTPLRVLLDRLKFRLQPIQPEPAGQSSQPAVRQAQPIPDDEANIMVKKFLEKNHQATAREVAEGVGIALGRVSRQPAWRAELGRRLANKVHTPKKMRGLSKKMMEAIGRDDDPSAKMDAKDAAWQTLIDQAEPAERAKLFALGSKGKDKLIQTYLDQFADAVQDADDDCS